jgi:transposase-like protein
MQNYKCKECGRQFSLHPDDNLSPRIRRIVIRLLLYKVSVEVITSAVEISKQVVLDYKKKVGKLWDV